MPPFSIKLEETIAINYIECFSEVSAGERIPRALTVDLLMKVVRKSALVFQQAKEKDSAFSLKIKGNIVWDFFNGKKTWNLLVGKDHSQRLHIVKWQGVVNIPNDSKIFLGRGNFGVVHKVFDFMQGEYAAMKFYCPKDEKSASENPLEELEMESQRLSEIHGQNLSDGLQAPPRKIFCFTKEGRQEVGQLQKWYNEKDLKAGIIKGLFHSFTKKEVLSLCLTLLGGLHTLHKKAIHGDIKPENCFLERVGGIFNVAIGDFGGARLLASEYLLKNPAKPLLNFSEKYGVGTIFSPLFLTKSDNSEALRLARLNRQEEWVEVNQARDVYAMSTTIWILLTGIKLPYNMIKEINGKSYPDTSNLHHEELVQQKIGFEATFVLIKALKDLL